jgi:hypothetical protein
MDFIVDALTARRNRLTAVFTAGTLTLIVALLGYSVFRKSALPPPQSALLFLLPLSVYLVGRFARTTLVAQGTALLWLAMAAWLLYIPESASEPSRDAYAAAMALSAAALLLKLRWAAYFWYVTLAAFAANCIDMLVDGLRGSTAGLAVLMGVVGLMLLMLAICAAVISKHTRAVCAAPATARQTWLNLTFSAAFLASIALGAWQWSESRLPNTAGIEQVHESLRYLVKGGEMEPRCDKVTFCGELVQFSCHPESDGLVSFHNNRTGALVMNCGGACMGGSRPGTTQCGACPPPEWERCVSR